MHEKVKKKIEKKMSSYTIIVFLGNATTMILIYITI